MNRELRTAREIIQDVFTQTDDSLRNSKTSDNLFIWGGQIANDNGESISQLPAFFQAWSAEDGPDFDWMMVEEVDRFYVKTASLVHLATHHELIERVRLFGQVGDLDIRRDGREIYWRFISETHSQLPSAFPFSAHSFWDDPKNKGVTFARYEQCYFQWRRTQNEPIETRERRVTSDWADDPALATIDYLRQAHYLQNGRVVFVRYIGFEESNS